MTIFVRTMIAMPPPDVLTLHTFVMITMPVLMILVIPLPENAITFPLFAMTTMSARMIRV
jgi:hypothetical protein